MVGWGWAFEGMRFSQSKNVLLLNFNFSFCLKQLFSEKKIPLLEHFFLIQLSLSQLVSTVHLARVDNISCCSNIRLRFNLNSFINPSTTNLSTYATSLEISRGARALW